MTKEPFISNISINNLYLYLKMNYNRLLIILLFLASNRREMLRKHFPDWEERMNYQKKQEKIYRSGLARMTEAKRVRMEKTFKLTKKEQDAFDYFNGKNFYKEHQSIETPPNIYDTRWSFLLKIEKNKDMRENFLKSYNRKKIEN